jgi:hypothetical protein
MSATFLAELGEAEQALTEAEPLAERLQAAGNIYFTEPRSLQLRLLAERGAHEHAPALDELVARARESGEPQDCALAFAAATQVLLAQGQAQRARALLAELEQAQGLRAEPYYLQVLAGCGRTALALDDAALARRLVDGVEAVTPLAEHALTASRAQLAEADGDHAQAAVLYAQAAERWHEFGNVPERSYALLGQGRCLTALGKPEAVEPLREARELFRSMGYRPALEQCDALLGHAAAAART